MHSLSIILIAGLRCFFRISDVNYTKRYMAVGKSETFLEIALYSTLRICAAPYCAKTEINSSQEDVLYRRRAILYPILRYRSG